MVGFPIRGRHLTLLAALCFSLSAQTTLSLEEAAARNPSAGFQPAHLNELVSIAGVVNTPIFDYNDHKLLALEDGSYGAVIKVPPGDSRLDNFRPGDHLQVEGTVAAFGGMVVILPRSVVKLGHKPAPSPIDVPLADLMGFRYLGRLVRTEARVQNSGENSNGVYLYLDSKNPFIVYMPAAAARAGLSQFVRKTVSITGISYQFAYQPPYDHHFQILVHDPAAILPVATNWMP